jgi:catechol 2,3-dioxygenase-like lactoylglutathione lyase family enzyme
MPVPIGLNHVAMSVADGTLTDTYRADVLRFYGEVLGWREIESLRLADRITFAVGRHTYLNLRERPDPMVCSGYEHLGIVVESGEVVDELWATLDARRSTVDGLHLEELGAGTDGFRSFRFRYRLPMAIEVQYFP